MKVNWQIEIAYGLDIVKIKFSKHRPNAQNREIGNNMKEIRFMRGTKKKLEKTISVLKTPVL